MTKTEIRKIAKEKVKEFIKNPVKVLTENAVASRLIIESPRFKSSDIVFSYIATSVEADPIEVTEKALKLNKKVAVPKVTGEGIMEFYALEPDVPVKNQLQQGSFGILEPKENLQKIEINSLKFKSLFVIVPGVAFSKKGKRCGHGKGFYDRYFSRLKEANVDFFKAGFCFSCQIFEDSDVPSDEFDEKMDVILSQQEL